MEIGEKAARKPKLMKMGVMTAVTIGIHNFRKECYVYGCLDNPTLGISIATAIAIHNIPEGIAVPFLSIMPREAAKSIWYHPAVRFGRTSGSLTYIPHTHAVPVTRSYGMCLCGSSRYYGVHLCR